MAKILLLVLFAFLLFYSCKKSSIPPKDTNTTTSYFVPINDTLLFSNSSNIHYYLDADSDGVNDFDINAEYTYYSPEQYSTIETCFFKVWTLNSSSKIYHHFMKYWTAYDPHYQDLGSGGWVSLSHTWDSSYPGAKVDSIDAPTCFNIDSVDSNSVMGQCESGSYEMQVNINVNQMDFNSTPSNGSIDYRIYGFFNSNIPFDKQSLIVNVSGKKYAYNIISLNPFKGFIVVAKKKI